MTLRLDRRRPRAALGLLAAVVALGALGAPAADATGFYSPFKGSTTVTGQIVIGATGRPAARACVVINGSRGYGNVDADRQGRFRFRDIPRGRYVVTAKGCPADKLLYVNQSSKARISVSGRRGTTTAARITIEIGGSITGTVTDATTGRPADDGCAFAGPERAPVVKGSYRLAQVPPGPAVSVSFHVCNGGDHDADRYPFTSVYWPGTRDATQARTVVVRAGHTTTGIDIALTRMGRITGTVTDGTTGKPVANACVAFDDGLGAPTNGQGLPYPGARGVPTTSDGEFDMLMPPGTYVVGASDDKISKNVATCGTGLFWYPGTADLAAAQHITVTSGATTSGIAITTPPGFLH
ncbi:MAG TPA: carboxypeptidase-like regulatory domain-containing protein [Baekduia sp.]|jgi:hypothetical protein